MCATTHSVYGVPARFVFECIDRSAHVRFQVSWKEGADLFDRVETREGRYRRLLPVRPDAFFTLEGGMAPGHATRIHYFLEADRSTNTHSRLEDKLTAYWHYRLQQLHTKKYGIETFRTLTIAITPERAQNLCELARKSLPGDAHKFFLFGSLNGLSLDNPRAILEPRFTTPRDVYSRDALPLVPLRQTYAEPHASTV